MKKYQKRRNRQNCLSEDQVSNITRFLDKSDETNRFLSSVNSLLCFFANKGPRLTAYEVDSYKILKKISNLADELAHFLELEPLESGGGLTKENMAEFALSHLVLSFDVEQWLNKDRNLRVEYLHDLPQRLRHLNYLINHYHEYQLTRYAPVSKAPDFELESFSKNLIFRFQAAMERLPVISPTNPDFSALKIIYEAFNYHVEDDTLLNTIKKACKERRASLGMSRKFKVDFRTESDR